MDKYEYQAKLEEINKLVEKEGYEEAIKIADTIDWKRVRSVRTLCMISELYETVGRPEDSKAILYRAYRRSPNSRQILYRLTEVCVQTQDFDDAVEYYTEYVNLSPNDNSKYILKYAIYKGRGSSLEEQIAVLEELKNKEYTEQWAYELAELYDQAGMIDKCVAECDDLALWFHNGKYVVQALELKKKYRPLTREQQTVYDNPSEIVDMETKEEVVEKAVPTLDEVITKELPKSEKDVIADSIIMDTEKEIAAAVQAPTEEEPKAVLPQSEAVQEISTVNLQSELANSMREILSGARPATDVEELESVPVMPRSTVGVQAVVEEERILPQPSIDDLLTGEPGPVPVEKTVVTQEADVVAAPTIDISKKIQQEIGDTPIREYAAAQKEQPVVQTSEAESPVEAQEPEVPVFQPEDYTHDILDEKEKSMLGFWSMISGMNEQVNQAITLIMRSSIASKTSAKGNVLLVGDPGNGRTTLAISLAKIISRCKGLQSVKVAKIYAEDINKKDIAATVSKMAGGVLIIEEAGDLSDEAIAQLSMAMDFKTDSLIVILEDEGRYLQDMLARVQHFAEKFDVTINVPMLTNDELVEFGKYYANVNECALDDSAVEILYENIGVMQSPEQPVAILDVKEIVDKAMKSANRFGVGKLTSSISGKRYDESDRVLLKGKNFKKIK